MDEQKNQAERASVERRPYRSPQLQILGDVKILTAGGSPSGSESNSLNRGASFP
jgi:hypothetical protein